MEIKQFSQFSKRKRQTDKMVCKLSVKSFLLTVSFIAGVTCDCPKFTVYDNFNNEIDANSVCLNLYSTPNCSLFYSSFNQSNLPSGFPTWDFLSDSVEKPEDIKVAGIETPIQDRTVPGFNITWTPPMSGASRKNCYGYLITWYSKDTEIRCRLLHLKPANSSKLRYKLTLDLVGERTDYSVRIYSVPTYELEAKDDKRKFAFSRIATMAAYRYPGEWAPSITYQPHENGTISVSFSLPPPQFNITNVRLFLNKILDMPNPPVERNYILPLRTDERSEFSTTISTNVSDNYSITVWVIDDYRDNGMACKCWIIENERRTCKNLCGGTETNPFFLNITDDLTKTTSTPSPVSSSVGGGGAPHTADSIIDEHPGEAETTTIVVIICVVVAVTLLVFVVFICFYRQRRDVKKWIAGCFDPPQGKEKPPKGLENIEKQPAKVGNLAKKTVYIISADDHEAHVKLVESFANFLKVHCHCNVIQPSDSSNHVEATYEWFIKSISSSNYIIFVDSLVAEKRFEAYINKLTDDANNFFQYGLQYLMVAKSTPQTETLIHVTFNGNKNSNCRQYLTSAKVYNLPDHIPQLLHKIHELDNISAHNLENVLPLIKSNIPTLPEAERIMSALREVECFEKKNPNWLKQALGKPLYERLLSGDSGCPSSITVEEDALESVSQCSRSGSLSPGCELPASFVEDDFSRVITIAEGKGMDESEDRIKESKLGDDLVPPMQISDIDKSDGISQLINQINENSEALFCQNMVSSANSSHQPGYFAPREGDQNFMQRLNSYARANRSDVLSVVPPVNLDDLQFDSISTALGKFNLDNASTVLGIYPEEDISTTLINRNQNAISSAPANINLGFDDSTEFINISAALNQRNGNNNFDPVPKYLYLDNGNVSHQVSTDSRTVALPNHINTRSEACLLDQNNVYLCLSGITNECSDCDAVTV